MILNLKDISFSYPGTGDMILDGFNLSVNNEEIFTLLGGSGSGKTTLLNIIAGFIQPNRGHVILNGEEITNRRPERRGVGVVFQDYALFPHMSVEGNIGFGPRSRGFSRKKVGKITGEMLEIVGLGGYEKRDPSELSGGEKQRVALARTLAVSPKLVLLDEPLSALDTSLRESLRRDLKNILVDQRIMTIYVTHDQSEALAMSDRIGVLHGGKIIEKGKPEEIYWSPKRRITAEFMGFPNSIDVIGVGKGLLETDFGDIPWRRPKKPISMLFRPESILSGEGDGLRVAGDVISVEYRGRENLIEVKAKDKVFRILNSPLRKYETGDAIEIDIPFDSFVPIFR